MSFGYEPSSVPTGQPLPSEEGTTLKVFRAAKPRPESGLDCSICAEFTGQRRWASPQFEHGRDTPRPEVEQLEVLQLQPFSSASRRD